MDSTDSHSLQSDLAYSAMVEDILAGISNGQLKLGQRIASETKLKAEYGISITSIKRGLTMLVERGVLVRRRGSGTFVASTTTAPPQPLVRRDTIAIIRYWHHWRYHPFYSEQHAGILSGLAKHGWKALDLRRPAPGTRPENRAVSYRNLSQGVVKLELSQHPEVAGLICVQADPATVDGLAKDGHTVVATGYLKHNASVDFDWAAETERLFRLILEKGARHIGVVGSRSTPSLETACRRAAAALEIAYGTIDLHILRCAASKQGSELITQAYQVTKEAFQGETRFDGLVITSDFEAMGVIDALTQLPDERWQEMPIVAQISKESKLPVRIPMTVLVADGYAHGTALADMINEELHMGGASVNRMTMSCYQVEWE